MAVPLGLSHQDRRAYEAALKQTQHIRITVRIHDRDEKVISTIGTTHILGGGVTVDMAQAPIRQLELVLLQPRKAPAWLPEGPGDASVFADNFVSVLYGIKVNDLSDGPGWIDVPVFWGTITGIAQDGDEVTIQAGGKEMLGLDPYFLGRSLDVPAGQKRTVAIRRIMQAQGETRFDMPDFNAKVGKKMSLNRHAQTWRMVKAIAGGANWQVFFDGRGRVRVRRWPGNRVWTFRDGDVGTVTTRPRLSYDITAVRNVVEVMGPEPKGPPKRIVQVTRAKAKHHLSAWSLRRNGVPREARHVVDSNLAAPDMEWHPRETIKRGDTVSVIKGHWGAPSGVKHPKRWLEHAHAVLVNRKNKAREIAERQLKQRLKETIETSFETLVIPHLEEGDKCAVYVGGRNIEFTLKQFTIPLQSDALMSVGVTKRVPMDKKKRKHKRRPRR